MLVISLAAEPRTRESILSDKGITTPLVFDVSPKRRSAFLYLMRAADYDVLYFRDPWLIFPALFARFIKGKRIVFEVHGSHEWRFLLPLWHFAVRSSNGVVFITKKLAQYYHVRQPYIVAPTNAITVEQYNTSVDLLRIGVPSGMTTIMYAGSFLWYSVDVLVSMMQELRGVNVHLVFVGPTANEEEAIHRQMKKEGLEGRYTIVKRIVPAEVPVYLCAADILVNPLSTVYPGSVSSKLYEYLAAGKPIISTLGGANDEVIENEVNGILIQKLDGKLFAKAVLRIVEDEELASRLGKAARASALQYTWEARAQKISELLEKVMRA